ncbi:MAG: ABC transporter ATP-binding protein [Candidatus Nanopelagicales bacterium]|nr:ABC transporter ATP-binding protein [Candidatus Nanopelagicales bacterium]
MSQTALQVDDLVVRYGVFCAVDQVSFSVAAGQVTALVGPNGAGKTSTIEVCTGLRMPFSGSVRLFGRPPTELAARARIGVMLQLGGLYPTAKPMEWLTYLARLYSDPADPGTLLRSLGIDPKTKTATRRMSGGEQQRVKLAAALLPQPDLLFLDEPTAGLDPAARRDLLAALSTLSSEGAAIVLTTHQLADVEEIADFVLVLAAGHLVASGTVAELVGAGNTMSFRATAGLDLSTLAKALGAGFEIREARPGQYLVNGLTSPQLLADITKWCAANGVQATEIRSGARTLEDIVIEATRGQK